MPIFLVHRCHVLHGLATTPGQADRVVAALVVAARQLLGATMTRFEPTDGDETFEVSASPDTVGQSGQFQGANVCRVAMLSTRFADDRDAIEPLTAEFRDLGLSDRVISTELRWGNRDQRVRRLAGLGRQRPPAFGGDDSDLRV
jgi:hypothetical protein